MIRLFWCLGIIGFLGSCGTQNIPPERKFVKGQIVYHVIDQRRGVIRDFVLMTHDSYIVRFANKTTNIVTQSNVIGNNESPNYFDVDCREFELTSELEER